MKNYFLSLLAFGLLMACGTTEKQVPIEEIPAEEAMSYRVDSTGFDMPLEVVAASSPLEGASNFRKPFYAAIASGKIYRSDALHELTASDIAYLDSLGIKTVIDLRGDHELVESPDKEIPSVVHKLHFPIGRDMEGRENLPDSTYKKIRSLFMEGKFKEVEKYMGDLGLSLADQRKTRYESFALNHRQSFGQFMKALADSSNYPIVYHCQGGKDRAGFASALMEKTLGASDEEILQDYLMTNVYGYEKLKSMKELSPNMKTILGAHADQIKASFEAIETAYGSFENYLKEGLALTEEEIAAIRTNLLAQS